MTYLIQTFLVTASKFMPNQGLYEWRMIWTRIRPIPNICVPITLLRPYDNFLRFCI